MTTYSWEDQRRDIQTEVDGLFQRKVEIAPRAMAAIQCGVGDYDHSSSYDGSSHPQIDGGSILASLLKASPACCCVLFSAGVHVDKLTFHPLLGRPGTVTEEALGWLFKGVESAAVTRTFNRVKRTGLLREVDILTSAIEASLQGNQSNDFGDRLLHAGGIRPPTIVRGGRSWPRTYAAVAEAMNTGAPIDDSNDWKAADSYLKKIKQAVMTVPKIDLSHCQIQFVFYEDERKVIRVRPFGVSELATVAVSDVLSTCRSNVSQPPEILIPDLSTTVLAQFEDLLNHRNAAETDFQKFFESHPFLLTAFEFKKAHPQPILYKDDGGVLIPDFFLEKLSPGWDAVLMLNGLMMRWL